MTVQQLKEQIEANSKAWWATEDEEERKRLHEENVSLYGLLDGQTGSASTFDSATGRWSTSEAGKGGYQVRSAPAAVDRSDQVRATQEAANAKALAALNRAKEQSAAALEEQEAAIDGVYRAAKNRTAAQNEIQRKSTGEWASDRGLSSGAAGQVALSQSVAAQRELGALEAQEAAAYEAVDRARSQMERDYAMAIAEAKAEGDQALAEALYKEANRFDQAQLERWKAQEELFQDVYQTAREEDRQEAQDAAKAEQTAYDREQDALDRAMEYAKWERQLGLDAYQKEQDALDRNESAVDRQRRLEQQLWERERAAANDAWGRQKDQLTLGLRQQELANTQSQRSFENHLKVAQDMAKLGSFAGYIDLGFSQNQVEAMEGLWREWKTAP